MARRGRCADLPIEGPTPNYEENMEIDHVYETLKMAIYTLAASTGRIQERLWEAWLVIHTVKMDDFPPELRDDFRKLSDALTPHQSARDANGGARSATFAWAAIS
jgi:hypothetical protein